MSRPVSTHSFPATLASFRTARDWSQRQLADEAGYDHSYISRLEAGSREPSNFTVAVLAGVLGLGRAENDLLHISAGYLPPGGWVLDGPGCLIRVTHGDA